MRKPHIFLALLFIVACNTSTAISGSNSSAPPTDILSSPGTTPSIVNFVPQEERWGIYRLDINSREIELIFSSQSKVSYLRVNNAGDQVAFSMKAGEDANNQEEIFSVGTDGGNFRRITDNSFWNLYPAWSPDDSKIAFLTQRNGSLGIYVMNEDGSQSKELFDTNAHEADIDWVGSNIAFTKDSRIWLMNSDGSDGRPISDPPRAGEWGSANLPFGDYDPRISPDGSRVIFERLLADDSPNGNYDFFVIDLESSQEIRLTDSGYSQGLASWSHSGEQLVYIVAAIDQVGQYDMYIMNADGTQQRNITPDYFPDQFLCHWAVFSSDDSAVYFIGEWWVAE
jgi:TolB protein